MIWPRPALSLASGFPHKKWWRVLCRPDCANTRVGDGLIGRTSFRSSSLAPLLQCPYDGFVPVLMTNDKANCHLPLG